MNIYFIRHGETVANKHNTIQGIDDVLTEKGRQQAEILAHRLCSAFINEILTSPLPRALETAKIIGQKLDLTPKIVESLTEITNPSSLIGLHSKDEKVLEANSLTKPMRLKYPAWKYEDEENYIEIMERVQHTISYFVNQSESADNILVISHGKFIRAVCACMMLGEYLDHNIYQKLTRTMELSNNC